MRLWVKITAICISVIFAVMSICFFTITQIQANSLRGSEEENAKQSLIMYSNNIISASKTVNTDVHDRTLKSIVSYYFSDYSRLVQTEKFPIRLCVTVSIYLTGHPMIRILNLPFRINRRIKPSQAER